MFKIPPYFVKRGEEIARGVAVAVLLYVLQVMATWNAATLDDWRTALRSVLAGAAVVAYATLRALLTPKAAVPPPVVPPTP